MPSLDELRREREIHQNSARLIERVLAGLRDSYRLGKGFTLTYHADGQSERAFHIDWGDIRSVRNQLARNRQANLAKLQSLNRQIKHSERRARIREIIVRTLRWPTRRRKK